MRSVRSQRALIGVLVLHACGVALTVSPLLGSRHAQHALAGVFHDAAQTSGPGADFLALYHAGVQVRRGDSPYRMHEDPPATPYFYPYRYLPATAQTLGRAATYLPPYVAALAWIVVIELALLFWVREVRRASACRDADVLSCLLLLSTPFFLEMYLGQFTFVATVLACMAAIRWEAHPARAAWLWAAAVYLKVFPLVALPAFITARRVRGVLVALAALVAINLPFFWRDPYAGDEFWSRNFLGEPVGLDAGNYSLLYGVYLTGAALRPWNLPLWGWITLAWRVSVLGSAAVLVLVKGRDHLRLSVAILLLAHFLSYFQVWEHHYSAALIVGTFVYLAAPQSTGWLSHPWLLAALVLIALPTPYLLLPADSGRWTLLQRLILPLSKALPLSVVFAMAGRHLLVSARIRLPAGRT